MTDKTTPSREDIIPRICCAFDECPLKDAARAKGITLDCETDQFNCRADAIIALYEHHLTTSPAPPDHGESAADLASIKLGAYYEDIERALKHHLCEDGVAQILQEIFGDSALRRISAATEKPDVALVLSGLVDCLGIVRSNDHRDLADYNEANCAALERAIAFVKQVAEPAASVPVTFDLEQMAKAIYDAWPYMTSHWDAAPEHIRKVTYDRARAALSLLASHSPPAPRAAGVGDLVEEIAKRHEVREAMRKAKGGRPKKVHQDVEALLSLIRRQHGGEGTSSPTTEPTRTIAESENG